MGSLGPDVKSEIDSYISKLHADLRAVNHKIWSNPETAYTEHIAHDTLCDFLVSQGFTVTRHAHGVETAFEARAGSGGRLVSFNAEYDALPNIRHACGHNLIATSSLTAFLALAYVLDRFKIPGRAQLLGTPAEEGGGGKIKLLDAGAYEGVDVCLMGHPGPARLSSTTTPVDGTAGCRLIARQQLFCTFRGRNAHAGGNPWDGVNALDALVAAYTNVEMLRQQTRDLERIHCAFTETPRAANIIPALAKATFATRSPTLKGLTALSARVERCVRAGAMGAECEVEVEAEAPYADILLNEALCSRTVERMASYGHKYLSTIPDVMTASSDIGNITYALPTMHTMFAIPTSNGSFPHHKDFTAAAGTDEAHDVAVIAGKGLALVGWDAIVEDGFYEEIRREWKVKVKEAESA